MQDLKKKNKNKLKVEKTKTNEKVIKIIQKNK